MFTFEKILNITSAIRNKKTENVTGVSTDSRSISRGELFIALRGDKFDGHKYAGKAVENGAAAIICDHKLNINIPQFIVDNTLAAYHKLARYHRLALNIPVIGITGTNGKTTVKEMINSILSYVDNPLCSEANFNNHIGVPETLLKIKKEHTQAIIEMGMNHPGEIKTLSEIAIPDVAVITSIGRGHIEFLGSVEDVVNAKLEILRGLNKNGTIILPRNSDFYEKMKRATGKAGIKKIITFGDTNEADVSFVPEKMDETGTTGTLKTPSGNAKAKINIAGQHNCRNAAAAVAAAMTIKKEITPEVIAEVLGKLEPVNMRCQFISIDGVKIISDCYNANPDSTRAALDLISDMKTTGRKIALLGDMYELGLESENYHKEIGAYAAEKDIDLIITTGTFSEAIISGAKQKGISEEKCRNFPSIEKTSEFLIKNIMKGDLILVKASRKARYEEVIKKLTLSAER